MINVDRCYFHGIYPLTIPKLRQEKKRKGLKIEDILEEERKYRLRRILDYGFIVPGSELKDITGELKGDHYIYLAQTNMSELPNVSNSFRNGEFSAFNEHISGNPSFVFDEHVIEGLNVPNAIHFLSEEICIKDKIPVDRIIAIALPCKTPHSTITRYLDYLEDKWIRSFYPSLLEKSKEQVVILLEDTEQKIKESYKLIREYQSILAEYRKEIPCISYTGRIYNEEDEYKFVEENREVLKRLIYSGEKIEM